MSSPQDQRSVRRDRASAGSRLLRRRRAGFLALRLGAAAGILAGVLASVSDKGPAATTLNGPAIRISAADSVPVPPEYRRQDLPPTYALVKTDRPPVIDGVVDDAAWQAAAPMGPMYLNTGGEPMKPETVVRMLRDDTYVYLAVQCVNPIMGNLPAVKGTRDRVVSGGETVELFVQTDRSAKGYVQVIFSPSGAFTDSFDRDVAWNGDIQAATQVDKGGWRLEARLRIADLGGGGKVDPYLWGVNVCHVSMRQFGSWAGLTGSFHQPGAFGLVTLSNGPAVDDLGLGVFAPPDGKSDVVPLRVGLRNLATQPTEYVVRASVPEPGKTEPFRTTVALAASGVKSTIAPLSCGHHDAVRVTILSTGETPKPVFEADLPVSRPTRYPNCATGPEFSCSLRELTPLAINAGQAAAYVMVQSLVDKPVRRSGVLVLREASGAVRAERPVEIDLPAFGAGAQRVSLPVDAARPVQYVLEWSSGGASDPTVKEGFEFYPLEYQALKEIVRPPQGAEVLRRAGCPRCGDVRDRALVGAMAERLSDLLDRAEKETTLEVRRVIVDNHRQFVKVLAVLRGTGRYVADRRGWLETAIISPVDDSAQPFALFVPYGYDLQPLRKYPLFVWLHGSGGIHLDQDGYKPGKGQEITDRLILYPMGRGRYCGYAGVSGDDVIRQIREVMADYRIDPDAVHLKGGSMGGAGVYQIATNRPDLFASCQPCCGPDGGLAVEQMLNSANFIHHGLADEVVPTSCSVMVAARMRAASCPVQLYLYPGANHDMIDTSDKTMPWEAFRTIRRDPCPRSVVLAGGLPTMKEAYWLSILRYADLHEDAYLKAVFVGPNLLNLEARNVAWAKVALPCRLIDPKTPLHVTLDGGRARANVTLGDATGVYLHLANGNLEATTQEPKGVLDATTYRGGGLRAMFSEGRPIRIVYGTTGGEAATKALSQLARSLRRWNYGRSLGGGFEAGGFPILKDTEVDDGVLKTCELILLGGVRENAVAARMAKDLPVTCVDGKVTVASEPAMTWPEESVAFSLFYRNPAYPERRIWWVVGASTVPAFGKLAGVSEREMFGPLGPELVVQTREKQFVIATAEAGEDWKLVRPGPGRPAHDLWPAPADMTREFGQFLAEEMGTDVSLAGGPAVNPADVDWGSLTVGEALALIVKRPVYVVPLSGRQLLDWRALVTEPGKDFSRPWFGLSADRLRPEAMYNVLVENEYDWDLGKISESFRGARYVGEGRFDAVKSRFVQRCVNRAVTTAGPAIAPGSGPGG